MLRDDHENSDGKMKKSMFKRLGQALSEGTEPLVESKNLEYPFATDYERKDWHDYDFIAYEKSRVGPGEHGRPFELTDPKEIEENKRLYEIEGLNALVSDKISVNRSIPDTRHHE